MHGIELNESNIKLAAHVAVGDLSQLHKKDPDFQNLFMSYAQDKNSSTLRERVSLSILGYESFTAKHGADGYDQVTNRLKEVKPIQSNGIKPIGNTGGFNDLTIELLEKKKDYDIVCSLFCNFRLIYLVEFPMSVIYEHLKSPILVAKAGKRVVCKFSHTNYDNDLLKVHYFDSVNSKKYKCLSAPHMSMLEKRNKNDHLKYFP
jgi:hypothetical protein